MTELSEHQSRLVVDMLQLVEQFWCGNVSYYDLVGRLEGALDAGEFQDKRLVAEWYDFWTPMESIRAQRRDVINDDADVIYHVSKMDAYLKSLF